MGTGAVDGIATGTCAKDNLTGGNKPAHCPVVRSRIAGRQAWKAGHLVLGRLHVGVLYMYSARSSSYFSLGGIGSGIRHGLVERGAGK